MTGRDHRTRVEVLRLGHRPERDKRITTHVALVSRAFGASKIHVDRKDPALEKTVEGVNRRFGGDFIIDTGIPSKRILRGWKGCIVHLTMYGSPLDRVIDEIPLGEDILAVVGAEKVPAEVYDHAHFNVSVANQPHSEVSALALFLDRLFDGRELDMVMKGGEVRIHPTNVGKLVSDPGENVTEQDPFEKNWAAIPSGRECIRLMEMLGVSQAVMNHVKEVHRLGMEMVKTSANEGRDPDIDMELLEAGLLLHDIGRCRTHSIKHILVGADMASRLQLDQRLISIIKHHAGAGIPKEEAKELGLPAEDLVPQTLEEMIVCHADNLVGSRRRRPLSVPVGKLREKGAVNAADRMIELHSILERELEIDLDELI